MRIFLDANVLFSASNTQSAIYRLLCHLLETHDVIISDYAQQEAYRNILAKKSQWLSGYDALAAQITIVRSLDKALGVEIADKDRPILATAIEHHCDYLMTGDKRDFGHIFGQTIFGCHHCYATYDGQQEGSYFHGYYKAYCYLPLYCFCGNIPLLAQLRDCNRDASEGTVEALEKIVPVIRKRFGKKICIIVRGDSGFARESIMKWCEDNGLYYCMGFARNATVSSLLAPLFAQLKAQIEQGSVQMPCREFIEFGYRTQRTWSCFRRMIGKAEILSKGQNPRFIVTNLPRESFAQDNDKQRFEPRCTI